jgi:hypothetical protein
MAKFLPLLSLALSQGTQAFTTPYTSVSSRTRPLSVKLEGREIDGVLTPTNNFVLVKVAEIEEETAGGILLTGSVSVMCLH